MAEMRDLFPAMLGSVQSDRVSATRPFATGSILGPWSLHGTSIREWIAESRADLPEGRIGLQPAGWLEITLGDFPGWRPFASFSGLPAGRRIQLTTRHAYDGTMVETAADMVFDATLGRYAGFGSTSDGTLSGNSLNARILIAAVDLQAWDVDNLVFGWLQLDDQS